MKVLIVENSEPMRRLIKSIIVADLVQDVIERSDGNEALPAYRDHQPDVVLMDLKMTTMDGFRRHQADQGVLPGRTDRHRLAVGRCRASRTGAVPSGRQRLRG